jgi:hypothetical protein
MIVQGKIPGTESPVNIIIERGKVIQIGPHQKGSSYDFGGTDLYLCPGFFDPQVNGLAGVDLIVLVLLLKGFTRQPALWFPLASLAFFPLSSLPPMRR